MSKAKKEMKLKPGKAMRVVPEGISMILGLDLSLRSTGWSLCDLTSGAVTWGTIEPIAGLSGAGRLKWILEEVRKLIGLTSHDYARGDIMVAIENFAFDKGNKAHDIGMLHGVIRHGLLLAGCSVFLAAPLQLKKWVTGKSMAPKSLVLKYIDKRFGYDCDQEDAADALAAMTLARAFVGRHPGELLSFQKEVLDAIMKSPDTF